MNRFKIFLSGLTILAISFVGCNSKSSKNYQDQGENRENRDNTDHGGSRNQGENRGNRDNTDHGGSRDQGNIIAQLNGFTVIRKSNGNVFVNGELVMTNTSNNSSGITTVQINGNTMISYNGTTIVRNNKIIKSAQKDPLLTPRFDPWNLPD